MLQKQVPIIEHTAPGLIVYNKEMDLCVVEKCKTTYIITPADGAASVL